MNANAMGTHTFTDVGVVENGKNKQVLYAILLLEKELKEAYYQIKSCMEYGLDAFLVHFKEQHARILQQISDLIVCLRYNIHQLTKF